MPVQDGGLESLVLRASGGDIDAISELVRRYEPRLRTALHGKLRPELRRRLDTDDVLQSTLTLVLRDLPAVEYRGEAKFRNWLLTVAERRLQEAVRYHGAARRDVKREDAPRATAPEAPERSSPSEQAARVEEQDRLASRIGHLSPGPRRVIEMRAFEGLSFPEIAERLDLPSADAARQRYLRALTKVRASLDDGGGKGT